jgi:phytoene synthase
MDRALRASYRACARLTRREARNFYLGFATLPRRKRLAVCAVYAFCREADDIADGEAPLETKKAGLAELRGRLAQAASGAPSGERDLALADAIARFSVDPQDLADVVAGVEMDLRVTRVATYSELRRYAELVASATGLAILPVLAWRRGGARVTPQARAAAVELGVGMQLVNVLRDVSEDVERGRIYLPLEDLVRFGVTEEALSCGAIEEGTRALLSFETERAREALKKGSDLASRLPRHACGCPALLGAVYSGLLDRIVARGYDVFGPRIGLTGGEKLWLFVRTYLRATFR